MFVPNLSSWPYTDHSFHNQLKQISIVPINPAHGTNPTSYTQQLPGSSSTPKTFQSSSPFNPRISGTHHSTTPRSIAHHIHLLPQSNPINVKPYRYPHFQKTELEKQVAKLLDAGFIQLSHSLFSSLVLLVKKKDRSWRLYVDYRALNTLTIIDFPCP